MNCHLDRDMRNILLSMGLKTHLKYILGTSFGRKKGRCIYSFISLTLIKYLLDKVSFFSLLGCRCTNSERVPQQSLMQHHQKRQKHLTAGSKKPTAQAQEQLSVYLRYVCMYVCMYFFSSPKDMRTFIDFFLRESKVRDREKH